MNRKFVLILFLAIKVNLYCQEINWIRKADIPISRWMGSAVVCNEKIYLIDGRGEKNRLIYEYNPLSNQWSVKDTLSKDQIHSAVGVIQNKIYIVGGPEEGITKCFDPLSGKWQRLSSIPTLRYHTTYVVLHDKLHVLGGGFRGEAQPIINHEVYSPELDSWSKKSSLPITREGASATLNNKIYMIGGKDAKSEYLSIMDEYDPFVDKWTNKCSLPVPTLAPGVAVVDNNIFIIGGQLSELTESKVEITNAVYVYYPQENEWKRINNFPQKIQVPQVAVLGNNIYVIGGCNEKFKALNSVWCGEVTF